MAYYYQPGAPVTGIPAQIAADKPGMYPAFNGHLPNPAMAMPVQRPPSAMAGAPIIQQGPPPMPQPGGAPPNIGLAGAGPLTAPSPLAAATPGASPLQPGTNAFTPVASPYAVSVNSPGPTYAPAFHSGMYGNINTSTPTYVPVPLQSGMYVSHGLHPHGSLAYQPYQAPPAAPIVAGGPTAVPVPASHASMPTNPYMGRPIQPYAVQQPGTQIHAVPMVPTSQIGAHYPVLRQPGLYHTPPPQPQYSAPAGFAVATSMSQQMPAIMYAPAQPHAAHAPHQMGALSSQTPSGHPLHHIMSAAPGLVGPPTGASFTQPPGGPVQ